MQGASSSSLSQVHRDTSTSAFAFTSSALSTPSAIAPVSAKDNIPLTSSDAYHPLPAAMESNKDVQSFGFPLGGFQPVETPHLQIPLRRAQQLDLAPSLPAQSV